MRASFVRRPPVGGLFMPEEAAMEDARRGKARYCFGCGRTRDLTPEGFCAQCAADRRVQEAARRRAEKERGHVG